MHCYRTMKCVFNLNGTLAKFSFVFWEQTAKAMTFLSILKGKAHWEMPSVFRKAEKGRLWRSVVFCPLYFPLDKRPRHASTRDLQHRHSGNLSSSSFRKPELTSGSAAICNEDSNLCCLLQSNMAGTHQLDPGALLLLWRIPVTRELGKHRGLSSSNCLQLMPQAELAGFVTENTKLPLYLLTYDLKSSKALQTRFLFPWAFLICWGGEKTLDVWSWA